MEARGGPEGFGLEWALGSASAFGDNRPSNFAFRRDIRSGIVIIFTAMPFCFEKRTLENQGHCCSALNKADLRLFFVLKKAQKGKECV